MLITALITIQFTTKLCSIPFATGIELDYEELKSINGSCFPRDTCQDYILPMEPRARIYTYIDVDKSCTCNRFCSKYGTCCIDSIHRKNLFPNPRPECRKIKGKLNDREYGVDNYYYMVDKCSTGGEFDSMWKIPCETDWKEDNTVFPLVPVTSLLSSITYKNYFCLRCHEKTNDFLYWNTVLMGYLNGSANHKEDFAKEDYNLKYSHRKKTWMAIVGRHRILVPVDIRFEIPSRIESMGVSCEPNIIFECSDLWTDGSVREKCNAYQAIVHINKDDNLENYLKYRNPHCALCNFETLEDMLCSHAEFLKADEFDFGYVVDVNRFDGDILIQTKDKCGENLIWDPFTRTCRKLSCSDPRLEIRDRKCVPHFNLLENPEIFFS